MSKRAGVRGLVGDVVAGTRGHDLALYSAGVTFYAAIAVVPLLLVAVWLAGLLVGAGTVRELVDGVATLLPMNLGAERAGRALASSGASLGPPAAVLALVPGTLYGEGLVRAFDRLSRHGDRGRRSLRGRLGSLAVVAVSPVLLLAGLAAANGLVRALGRGTGVRLLGVYCAFLLIWLVVSPLLVLVYGGLAPHRPGLRALLWSGFGTGSIVAGFTMGFVLFLGIRLPIGRAYGGSTPIAAAAVCGLWLLLLHLVVLVGYVTALVLQARQGHPLGEPVERPLVQAA
jgi:membrane protein